MKDLSATKEPSWPSLAVAGLTVAWLVGITASVAWIFGLGLQSWADDQDNNGAHQVGFEHDVHLATHLLEAVAFGGPLVIACVAFVGGRTKTSAVYVGIAVLLGFAAAYWHST
ncbi:hypothetical protein ACTOB_004764 [Actinoplanes oblitus]|uniref:Uncharacterized protein n=1 Tax=Actinoplanes oblitus TaxID=3040509 RepID=A0ABY8W6M4_9ACTN|nr:hypothetical protein [Actinoplanes oblitus]WIM92806.1 hypothetical protein ACTOB_004764 [Actinoplanes oblitus]